ncbi:MAG: LysR family transcriptional regulator [Nocardioidaceae bacterium]|nr:LysR family transcriptional regulator [Nocardioidaceae bacterium]NUS50812.1 LysR family transcriptional regulator [Nocardioidaceae bacterium]
MLTVLTVDQQGSRTRADEVPALLDRLDETVRRLRLAPPARDPQRTVGDEVQAVVDDPDTTVALVGTLLRDGGWWVGLGVGEVEEPLPDETRAGRGPAYVQAREAVTRAKSAPHRIAVVGADRYRAEHLETVLGLWAGILERRTARGWEVFDAVADGLSYDEAARRLGISQSAVSQRAQAAGLVDERRARRLARDLLAEMTSEGRPTP